MKIKKKILNKLKIKVEIHKILYKIYKAKKRSFFRKNNLKKNRKRKILKSKRKVIKNYQMLRRNLWKKALKSRKKIRKNKKFWKKPSPIDWCIIGIRIKILKTTSKNQTKDSLILKKCLKCSANSHFSSQKNKHKWWLTIALLVNL